MPINQTLGAASANLVVSASVVYGLALVAHAAEWALGRRSDQPRLIPTESGVDTAGDGIVITAGDSPAAAPTSSTTRVSARDPHVPDERSDRLGRIGLSLTVLAFGLHLAGVALRGVLAQRAPWGNMYEFTTAGSLAAVAVYLILVRRQHARWLGLFVTGAVAGSLGVATTILYVDAGRLQPALHSY